MSWIGKAVLHLNRHEHPGHKREMKRHMANVAVSEIGHRVLGPLVGLGQQHAVFKFCIHVRPELPEEFVGLGQVFAIGALSLEKVGHSVEPHAVHAHFQPEVDYPEHRLAHMRAVVVEVRLMGIEPVPVIGLGNGVPGPVRGLEVLENDSSVQILPGRYPTIRKNRR